MKRLLCALLLLSCVAGAALADWEAERFIDEDIGLELMIPVDWTTSGGEGQYLFQSPDGRVCVSVIALGMTAEEYTPQVAEEMRGQIEGALSAMPEYEARAFDASEDPEDPGLTLMATYVLEEEQITQLVMIGLGNGKEMLNVTCTYPSEEVDEAEGVLESILRPLVEDEDPEYVDPEGDDFDPEDAEETDAA